MKWLVLLLALLLLISGCNRGPDDGRDRAGEEEAGKSIEDSPEATPEATQPLSAGTTVLADGQIVPIKPSLALSFGVSGRLAEIHIQPGDVVEEGALLATLDGADLSEALTGAELQVAQAENGLAQARLSLEKLLEWEPDETAVALAEANLIAAQANYENALAQDSAGSNSVISARISVDQAERNLADIQEAYDNAWDEARDWEQFYDEPTCLPGQGESPFNPCTGITWAKRIELDRDGTARALQNAEEGLEIARANYNLALAGVNSNSALNAEASIASARQALNQAQKGPEESDIAAARLAVEAASLSLEQAQFNLERARQNLDDALLFAPWEGTILSVASTPGAMIGAGTPVLTLLDADDLQFHTTNLSERDLADIDVGQSAEISLKSYPALDIKGTVARIVPQSGGQVGGAAVFTVVIDLEPNDIPLLPGMTGRAEIQREAR